MPKNQDSKPYHNNKMYGHPFKEFYIILNELLKKIKKLLPGPFLMKDLKTQKYTK